ncbi:hypothetical protein [Altererythrobacter lutimaris]|uniref:Uncharacterized protein n=1 Tax=Altererythrobacter lutimaris TaxID=2743979 RepID=A0A850HHX6_9SPHN|nr:hypothetical protein [Altererythrobacter lutimaris]NVE94932.1 hypothetical protein [Altererythrobacter lutimaris]
MINQPTNNAPDIGDKEVLHQTVASLIDALKILDKQGLDVASIHLNQAIEEIGRSLLDTPD